MNMTVKLKDDDLAVIAFSGKTIKGAFADIDKLITDETRISNETVEFMSALWSIMEQGVEPVTPEMIAELEAEEGEIQPDDRTAIDGERKDG